MVALPDTIDPRQIKKESPNKGTETFSSISLYTIIFTYKKKNPRIRGRKHVRRPSDLFFAAFNKKRIPE